ncbi:MAG: DeoR/GlpR transcriptional regulator, partial [Chloroflexota bacterium]|nr:DeoR/GlpR transcriptional regulator [Chloroflexota bacterium]
SFGGYYNGAEYETLGTPVIDAIRQFRADHAFLTVGALNAEQGWMDYRVEVAQVNKTMAEQARHTTILMDSNKLDGVALVTTCPLTAADRLVTTTPPSLSLAAALTKAHVEIHLAVTIDDLSE